MYLNRCWLRHNIKLVDYVLKQGQGRPSYTNLSHHLVKFRGADTLMCEINKNYVEGFVEYLKTARHEYVTYRARDKESTLSKGTQLTYFNLFCSVLNSAVRDSILENNPADRLNPRQKPHPAESGRTFLTLEEVKTLSNVSLSEQEDCICRAFLFCCFCGLRFSDVSMLKWGQIQTLTDGSVQLTLIQKKTSKRLYLPLSRNALSFMPDRASASDEDLIFGLPPYWDINRTLSKWVRKAGINKHITFHCSRHTFATMALNYGADIYTVSKLMGHSSVKTTQVYAKIIDETKRKAVEMIPEI